MVYPSLMGLTAIVLGATGVVGARVVDHLAASPQYHAVHTVTRRPAPHASPKVHNHVVDFERLAEHRGLFRADYLFSCLGTTRKQAGSIAAQRRVDFDYQLVAAQCAAANGVAHYLLVSAMYADAASRNAYSQMKGALEDAVVALPFPRVSIFQPSFIVGHRPDSRPAERAGIAVMQTLSWLPGIRRYRPIRGDDIARRMVGVSLTPGQSREWFRLDDIFPPTEP